MNNERDFTKHELETLKSWYKDNIREEFDNEMDFDTAYDMWIDNLSWIDVDEIVGVEEDNRVEDR